MACYIMKNSTFLVTTSVEMCVTYCTKNSTLGCSLCV